jgi:hypothetical protein
LSKHLHPPLVYSEFLKRNDDALLIRVVGAGQTPTTACYLFFMEHLQWRNNHPAFNYFITDTNTGGRPNITTYNFNIIIVGKTQDNRVQVCLVIKKDSN